ncbi:hypothetical protein [Tersicoccus phoenicis]|nr:hypothetical protein [Tersicoccus phoenicis]
MSETNDTGAVDEETEAGGYGSPQPEDEVAGGSVSDEVPGSSAQGADGVVADDETTSDETDPGQEAEDEASDSSSGSDAGEAAGSPDASDVAD